MNLRGADIVARALVRAGTRYVFALSGNHVTSVFDAALDAGLSLVHVRHEAAAVHMADAWGRLTGEAGGLSPVRNHRRKGLASQAACACWRNQAGLAKCTDFQRGKSRMPASRCTACHAPAASRS